MIVDNNPKPRVLVVSFAYYPMIGGLPQQASLLCRVLKSQKVDVAVVTIRIDGYPALESLDNVPVYRLWTFFGKESAGYRTRVYPWLLSLAAFLIVHQNDYDLIHIHQASYPAAVCVILGKMLGKPTVIRITGSGTSGNLATLRRLWWLGFPVRLIIRHTDCFVSLSEDITNELLAEGIPPDKIMSIQNGVDADLFSPQLWRSDPTVKTVLGVGRFSEEKGFDILVNAWDKVIGKEPNARLILVGEGQDMQALKELALQNGINHAISFEGNRDDVLDYLVKADVYVLPSRNEGMSNSLLEAMSTGRACVVSDIPANWSVITPAVNGLMFKNNDPDDLAERIVQLLRDARLAEELGANARRTIIDRFSIDVIARTYIQLYSRLIENRYSKN